MPAAGRFLCIHDRIDAALEFDESRLWDAWEERPEVFLIVDNRTNKLTNRGLLVTGHDPDFLHVQDVRLEELPHVSRFDTVSYEQESQCANI